MNGNNFESFFKRIIVPVDGSKLSEKAVKVGCFLAKEINKTCILFHVNEIPATALYPGEATYASNLSKRLKEEGKSILNDAKKLFSDKEITVQTKLVEGIAYEEIINFANSDDLIIMGSKGHSTVERVFIGSVSEKVLHHSDSSVMIVR
ncbi:MAG: universal stress protein [Candidatus Thermoplasmatota archaeon]|nr:universal stress protein [Candidatus Thermoplasmatota archaeon]